MDAVLPTPHVARFASDVDASLAGGNEGLARLAPLRAVLRRLARDPAVHHPGLVSECALDSIGVLLTNRGSADAEPHRRALMEGTPPADVRVWLARPSYRFVPVTEARGMSPDALAGAVALRGAASVAVPLAADARRRCEVRVAFGESGAQLVVRRRDALGVDVTAMAGAKHGGGRTTLTSAALPALPACTAPPSPPRCEEDEGIDIEAELAEQADAQDAEDAELEALIAACGADADADAHAHAHAHACATSTGTGTGTDDAGVQAELDALFAERTVVPDRMPPLRTPKRLERAQNPTFFLPDWLVEALATAFQEIGRVNAVLAAAAPQGESVLLAVESATLVQHHDRVVERDVRCVARLQLHAMSGTCICGAYPPQARRTRCGEPRHVLLEFQTCGLPFAPPATRCAAHLSRNVPPSSWDATCCVCDTRMRVVCQHEHGRPVALGVDVPPPLEKLVAGLAAIAAATCATPSLSNARAYELCRAAQEWERQLYVALYQLPTPLPALDHGDKLAEALLRSHCIRRGKPRRVQGGSRLSTPLVRTTGGGLRPTESALAGTHGHLFMAAK